MRLWWTEMTSIHMTTWLLRDNRIDRSIWNIILKRIHNLRYANDFTLKSKQLGMIVLQRKMIQFIIEHLSSNEMQLNFMTVTLKAAHDDGWRLDFMVIGRSQKEIWPNKPNKQFNFCAKIHPKTKRLGMISLPRKMTQFRVEQIRPLNHIIALWLLCGKQVTISYRQLLDWGRCRFSVKAHIRWLHDYQWADTIRVFLSSWNTD